MKTLITEWKAPRETKVCKPRGLIVLAVTVVLSGAIAAAGAVVAVAPLGAQTTPSPAPSEKFRGEILPDPDTGDSKTQVSSYDFYDEGREAIFHLDDQPAGKPLSKYIGRRVEVTGAVEKSYTIHMQSIKAVGW